ncbi:hypothetical protein, partial [Collinsella sp. AM36-4AA]|uniref:hypothetical protein n=1 Tax=Collinsella sp. AM36-4AA TaxID=2292317 RepID=UPI001F2D6AC5
CCNEDENQGETKLPLSVQANHVRAGKLMYTGTLTRSPSHLAALLSLIFISRLSVISRISDE